MKKIVAKIFIMSSIIFIIISICSVSTVDCLKSNLPIQQTFIFNTSTIDAINNGNINFLQYKLIPLFYISLIFILLSGIFNITNGYKINSIITIIISCIPTFYIVITHNYIWFLILFNIYLLIYVLINYSLKNKFNIFIEFVSLIIGAVNIIKLLEHLTIDFSTNSFEQFEIELINISKINLVCLVMWFIPYIILVCKEIIKGDNINEK